MTENSAASMRPRGQTPRMLASVPVTRSSEAELQ